MGYVKHYEGERKQDRPTPREFFEKLHARFRFTVDGAANPDGSNSMLPRWFAAYQSWEGERVFCNPPWSDIAPFVLLASTAEFACLLVPARTNCRWFHKALELGAKPDFFLGKPNFGGPWNSPVDCVLLLFGDPTISKQEVFGEGPIPSGQSSET
jgi:hypothetical protein